MNELFPTSLTEFGGDAVERMSQHQPTEDSNKTDDPEIIVDDDPRNGRLDNSGNYPPNHEPGTNPRPEDWRKNKESKHWPDEQIETD